MKKLIFSFILCVVGLAGFVGTASAEGVGKFTLGGWFGGVKAVVHAAGDPKVSGVTCYVTSISKSFSFIDPSNSSIACRKTGKVVIGEIARGTAGEEVAFSGGKKHVLGSFFKANKIRRIYDERRKVLIYVSYTTKVIKGSYKVSTSAISLN